MIKGRWIAGGAGESVLAVESGGMFWLAARMGEWKLAREVPEAGGAARGLV